MMKFLFINLFIIATSLTVVSCSKDKGQGGTIGNLSIEKPDLTPPKLPDLGNDLENKKEFNFSVAASDKILGTFGELSSLHIVNGTLVAVESIKGAEKEKVHFMSVGDERLLGLDVTVDDELAKIPVNGSIYKTELDDLRVLRSNSGVYLEKSYSRSYTKKNGDDLKERGGLFYQISDKKLRFLSSLGNRSLGDGLHPINFLTFVGNDEIYGATVHMRRRTGGKGYDNKLNVFKCPQNDCSQLKLVEYETYSDVDWDSFGINNVNFDDDHLFIVGIARKEGEENLAIIKLNEFLDEEFDMVTDSSKSGVDDNIDVFRIPLYSVRNAADSYFSNSFEHILLKGYGTDYKPSLISVDVSENTGESTVSKNLEKNLADIKDVHSISHIGQNYLFLYSTKANPEKRFISLVNHKNGNIIKVNGKENFDTGADVPYEAGPFTTRPGATRSSKEAQGQSLIHFKDGKIYLYTFLYGSRKLSEKVIEAR